MILAITEIALRNYMLWGSAGLITLITGGLMYIGYKQADDNRDIADKISDSDYDKMEDEYGKYGM